MKCKIAYVYISLLSLSGVEKKPLHQAVAVRNLGIEYFDIYVLNPHKTETVQGVHYVKFDGFSPPLHYIDFVFKHNFNRYSVLDAIPLETYDYIILRYEKADRSGVKLCKNHQVITEHHTNEYHELVGEGKSSNSYLIKLLKGLRAWMEKKYASQMLSEAAGIIAISQDVIDVQMQKINAPVQHIAIPNGIGVAQTKQTGYRTFDGHELNIVFPASHDNPYHGVDRILRSLDAYNGQVKITLHLAGNYKNSEYLNHPHVSYHGVLNEEELDKLMGEMHIGASTFAVFRRHINDPAALKTREYIARGLPFIIAYRDADLVNHVPEKKFYLEFSNDESLIDLNKVVDFVKELNTNYDGVELSDYMRSYAEKYLDWSDKLKQYVGFVHKIDEERRSAGHIKRLS